MNAPPASRRPLLRAALAAGLLCALLAALAATVWLDNAANRGVAFRASGPPIAYSDGPALGVNLYNLQFEPDPAAVERSFELARALGARYARMQAPWEDIEIHARGDFEDRRNLAAVGAVSAWDKYDRIVAAANAAEVELILRLERPPAWARPQALASPELQAGLLIDGNSTGPPDDYADYARFVRALVERYDGDGADDAPDHQRVRFFQIWNEPNLKNEWNWQEPRPEDFVRLLRAGAEAARAASPEAVILFPGLAPTDGLDSRAPMTELEYLSRVYAAGGAASFDIMSAQSYGLGQPPDEHRYVFLRGRASWSWRQPVDTRNDVSRVALLREVMERNGDAATPVWVSEFGWNSAPDSIPAERRLTWGQPVSEQQKGDYLVGQIERARQEWPWMGTMNVWMLRYGGYADPDPADPTPYFALVSRDWRPLPSYQIVQEHMARPAAAGVGSHRWAGPAVEPIAGGWRLRFSGARLTLVGDLGGAQVLLDERQTELDSVTLDGQPALRSAWLAEGEHSLELRAAAAPAYFMVDRARPWGWLWDYGPLALLLAIAAAGAATMQSLMALTPQPPLPLRRERGGDHRRHTASPPPSPAQGEGGWGGEGVILLIMALGLLIAYRASAHVPLTALGLAIFAPLALWRPDLALAYVPLTVALYFMPKGLFDANFGIRESGIYLPLHELVLLISAAGAALDWKRLRRAAGAISSRVLPVALFLLAGLWGFAVAEARGPALRELRWLVVEPLIFAGLLLLYARRGGAGYWRLILGFWMAGAALAGLVGILQVLGLNLAPLIGTKVGFSEDVIAVQGVRRATSLYGHPNNLGLAMGRAWPVAAALAHVAFWEGGGDLAQRLRRAWPPLLAALLCLGGLLASFSRGAYLGAAAAGLVLLLGVGGWRLGLGRRWRRGLATLVIVAGAAALGGMTLLALNVERFNLLGASSGIRVQTWASALAMLRDHPLGVGLDQFGRLYPQYIDPSLADSSEIYTAHPHNLLLDIALRMGPPGLVAFAWLLVIFFRQMLRQAGEPSPTRAASIGALAAMAGAVVHGLVDSFYFWPDLAFAFWLFLALAAWGQVSRPRA